MATTLHQMTILTQNRRRGLTLALAMGLACCLSAGTIAQNGRAATKPRFVDVELGKVETWIRPGSPEAEEKAVAIALDLVEAAYGARSGDAVIMRVSDYAVSFDALPPHQRSQVMAALDGAADPQSHYERALAWQMKRSIQLARGTQGSIMYGFAGIPVESVGGNQPRAGLTNSNYLSALNAADVIVAPQSFIQMGNNRNDLSRLRDSFAQTKLLLGERPLLYQVNNRWHLTQDLGDGVRVPTTSSGRPSPTADSTDSMTELFRIIDESNSDPTELLLAAWGTGDAQWDLNHDSVVDVRDLLLLLANWEDYQQDSDSTDGDSTDTTDGDSTDTTDGDSTDTTDGDSTDTTDGDSTDTTDGDSTDTTDGDSTDTTDGDSTDTSDGDSNDTTTDGGLASGIAQFTESISVYQEGVTGSLELEMLADAPAEPNVVFQTWSIASGSLEAPLVDTVAPFVYPGAALDQVTAGQGEIQAVVRDASNQVVSVVKMSVDFETIEDTTDTTDDDTTDTTTDDTTDSTDTTTDDTTDSTDTTTDDTTDSTDTSDDGGGSDDPLAPAPVITIIDTNGAAPFTVHVNGLETQLHRGDALTAQYAWEFGDPDGGYNTLVGWNAAHTYNAPGTYTITLTVTDEDGTSATATQTVNVAASTRRVIYLSSGGNDSNDGSSESKAVRTLSRAVQLLSNNAEIRIRRGASYDVGSSQMIDEQNVLITSYGTGADPTLWWTGASSTYAPFFEMNDNSEDIVIERIQFDAPAAAAKLSVRGIMPDGVNITVRNCTFGRVSDAFNNERMPTGVLIQDNHAGAIGAYFSWCQGTDFSIIGNTVEDSVAEHNIRFGGVERGLVYGNSLTNTFKACLWCMDGTYAYVANNEFHEGPVTIGPNEVGGSADAKLHWAVVEQNRHTGQGFRAHSGVEHVVYRNNAVEYDDKSAFTIVGHNDDYGRASTDIRILNNTAVNNSARGRFLEVTCAANDVLVANNMYVAPNLETGSNKTANVYIMDTSTAEYTFRHNLWATPNVVGWGDGWHYVYDYWSHRDGYLDTSEWAALGTVHSDYYREFDSSDLSATFMPEFNEAEVGRAEAGVHTDLNGNPRPLTGIVSAGAVEK